MSTSFLFFLYYFNFVIVPRIILTFIAALIIAITIVVKIILNNTDRK